MIPEEILLPVVNKKDKETSFTVENFYRIGYGALIQVFRKLIWGCL